MLEYAHAFTSGLFQIFAWPTFGLMLLGVGIGFIVGLLPGLGGPATIALLLPAIVTMKSVDAFAFLLGLAAVTATTGDITSILFGVPGEGTTAATIVDGHPMAKKGETGRALGAALMSSLIGAVFGAFALALAIPIVRPLVLSLGSPEFFMLAVLGLAFVASLSGLALSKGVIAAGVGLILATVGLDRGTGIPRFTLGQLFLWDGIGLIPIAIGFFAVPEIIELWVQGTSIAEKRPGKVGGVMQGILDTFRHWGLVLRCSAIGTYTAIVPGIGGVTTQWLAYAHAVQSSPDKQRFGKGAIEGVLGPGAANNSTLGGALITTVAFGVPTNVMMAILMGAFLIQGLVPGPEMLIPEPNGHLTLTFSFVWTIVISNIITVGACLLFLGPLIKVTYIRGTLLVPLIIVLIYLGAFAEKNAFADLFMMLMFGGVGWVMQRFNWPRPPLILGVVLGPLAESRLFLSVDTYSGVGWLLRPGVLVMIALIVAGAIYPKLKKKARGETKKRKPSSFGIQGEDTGRRKLKFTWAAAFDLLIVVMLIWILWESRDFTLRSRLFPWAIGIPILVLALMRIAMDCFVAEGGNGVSKGVVTSAALPAQVVRSRTVASFLWMTGFFLSIWLLGFSIGLPLITFLQLKIGALEKWWLSTILAVSVWIFIYGFFMKGLRVPLYPGLLFG
ncbi:MAG: tripartite tricarboxylate transporter permease [Desulfobacterales bacterium]|nr:tripartite tricarboxylate transporter permease [Desulfobacterales bacterium]